MRDTTWPTCPMTRFADAVGDVVGHGLEAAAVMGMLRSSLSAPIRALREPAKALEVLEQRVEWGHCNLSYTAPLKCRTAVAVRQVPADDGTVPADRRSLHDQRC
jgi:hypothetical protein